MDFFNRLKTNSELKALAKQQEIIKQNTEEATSKLKIIEAQIVTKEKELNNLKGQIEDTKGRIIGEELKAYSYPPKNTSSTRLRAELNFLNNRITRIVAEGVIINRTTYTVDGSSKKGEEFQKYYGESLVISFNNYFDKKAKAITVDNYAKSRDLVGSYFTKMNKRASIIQTEIRSEYLCFKLETLKLLLDIKISVAEERTKEIEEKRRLKEQERLLQEAEKEKIELAKQRRMYEQSLAKALTETERIDFEAKLKEIDKREADIDYRVNNAHAGYLYITATEAMPGMVKLGVTRRLNPLVRIQELSSASVPYPFICYGLVFSDDAFELETNIHEYFNNQRVNKENRHKEFFNITVQEAIDVLKNKFNCEVHFVGEDECIGNEEK